MFLQMVANEVGKMLRKRRFQVVIVILCALIAVFSYAEKQAAASVMHQLGTADWHARLQQEITSESNFLNSPFVTGAEKAAIQASIHEDQFELTHNINPYAPGAASFMKTFMDEGITLLIPMFIMVIASDIVSSEFSGGTVKMLLTRGVSRGKVLASKLLGLFVLVSLFVAAAGVAAYLISGLFFGYQGWNLPILMGLHTTSAGYVDFSHIYTIPQWKYLLMTFGLGFFVCLNVAALSFMVSTLVQSTASSMGIMMAALIAGSLLSNLATSWTAAKYLPVVNLQLSGYLNGSPPPISGMTFPFSVIVLATWSVAAIAVSFLVFVRRDVLG